MRALAGLPLLTAVSISVLTAAMSMVAGFALPLSRFTHGLGGAVFVVVFVFGAGVFGAGAGVWLPLLSRPLMRLTPSHFLSLARLPPSGRGCAWKFAAAGWERGTTFGAGFGPVLRLVFGAGVTSG